MPSIRTQFVACLAALVVVVAACGQAAPGTPDVAAQAPPMASGAAGETGSDAPNDSGATSEGISVHGHWTITVRDPDGTVASHDEFDNALALEGQHLLVMLLARTSVPGNWGVTLLGALADGGGGISFSDPPCTNLSGSRRACHIVEPDHVLVVPDDPLDEWFPTLSVTRSGPVLRLEGSATAMRDGAIDGVQTKLITCQPGGDTSSTSPEECIGVLGTGAHTLTETTISAVTVVEGQLIQVTVEISFE